MSLPEIILWRHLQHRKLAGLRFRRQHPKLECVLDFYCAERMLAVEVDGREHDFEPQASHDRRRDERLLAIGVVTLRVQAADVLAGDEPAGVLERIREVALARPVRLR